MTKNMNRRQVRLTEQDLHMLVEDAVRTYLVNEGIEEGVWGGLGNAMYGAFGRGNSFMNGMKNFKQNYQNGNLASDMQKYAQKIYPYLSKMSALATSMGDNKLAEDLEDLQGKLEQVGKFSKYNARDVAAGEISDMTNGGEYDLGHSMNPWEDVRQFQNRQNAEKEKEYNQRYQNLEKDFNTLSSANYNLQQDFDRVNDSQIKLQHDYTSLQKQWQDLNNKMAELQNSGNKSAEEVEKLKQQIETEKQQYVAELEKYKQEAATSQQKLKAKNKKLMAANKKIKGFKAQQQPTGAQQGASRPKIGFSRDDVPYNGTWV
jgi:hypothetical protein